jgi:hypothetical protein
LSLAIEASMRNLNSVGLFAEGRMVSDFHNLSVMRTIDVKMDDVKTDDDTARAGA